MNKGRMVIKLISSLIVLIALICPAKEQIQSAPSVAYFVVNSEEDYSAPGGDTLTLREAIGAANGDPGHVCGWGAGERALMVGCSWDGNCISGGCGYGVYDTIMFAAAVDEIKLWVLLPPLTDAGTMIDGYNIDGSKVVISTYEYPFTTGSIFELRGANQTISNLSIVNGVTADILVWWTASGARIAYNYLGTLPGATSCSVSGVSRNSADGVWVRSGTTYPITDRAFIYGNVIGCHWTGILAESDNSGFDEVIIGYQPDKTTADGNWIGISPSGASIPNAGHGIDFHSSAQTYSAAAYNTIVNNGGAGISMVGSGLGDGYGIFVRYNSIYGNHGLPFDLGNNGFTPNDAGDRDSGPNNLINYPEITATNGSQVWGTTCGLCKVDIYQAIGNPAEPGGGGIYKGSVTAELDGSWYVDLSTLPGMSGATIYDVSFATYGLYDGSSEMSPRPQLYLPVIKK